MLWGRGTGRLNIQSQVLASFCGAMLCGLPAWRGHSLQAWEELKKENDEALLRTPVWAAQVKRWKWAGQDSVPEL